ncbi:PPE domain-containing protein [Nocardia sp. IBHARD005]|uniref:PPE domain-containing protein n=1 Tax=Nocardia sp. IBHARD005 TaxID=3457765 RepID=UPI0040585EFF
MGWGWQETVGLIPIAGTYLAGGIGGWRESHEAATERGRLGEGASNQWSPDRTIINDEYQRLGSGFTGTPAGKVVEPEGFGAWPHWMIYARLNGADGDPGVSAADINAGADAWRRLTTTVDELITTYDATIARVIGEMWSGQAANAAVDGVREYATQAKQLPTAFQLVANGIDLMEGYLAQAKMAIPEPEELSTWDKIAGAIPGNGLLKGDRHQYNEAEAAAQELMTNFYSPGSVQVDGQTPVLPVAKNTLGELGDGDRNGGGPGTNTNQPGGGDTGRSTNPATTTEDPSTGDPETTEPDTEDVTTGDDDTTSASTTPETTPTTPAGTPATTPTGGVPSGSGAPGSGSPSAGAPGSGLPGSGSPVAGIAQPGKPGAGSAGGVGNSAAAARGPGSGTRGMPGMMGGGGAGRGQGGDDETEHKIPDYLIHERESELIGQLPAALPPGGVIG